MKKASRAARTQSYSGTQFVSSWTPRGGSSAVVDIAHLPGKGSLVSVEPTSRGAGGRVFDIERTLLSPLEAVDAGVDLTSLDDGALALLQQHYDVVLGGAASCVGRAAQIVEVRRRGVQGKGQLAGRFWIDDASGLVLRREVLDSAERTVRASAFIDLDLSAPAAALTSLPPAMGSAVGERLDDGQLAAMRRRGWAVPAALPHDLDLYDGRSREQDGRRVLHLSYSDGLSAVSLFEQRGRLDTDRLRGWHRERMGGATVYVLAALPQRVVWAGRGMVYTLIADAPHETVEAAVASLPHRAPSASPIARLGRGLARVGSWVNPFS